LHGADSVGVKLTRAEYVFELHGDIASATAVMRRALEDSTSSADQAFAHYVGELAFNAGNPSAALAENEAGPQADPGYAALRQGKARAEVTLGVTDAAVRDYATVVSEVPQPQYLVEFGELLASLGRDQEAQAQYAVLAPRWPCSRPRASRSTPTRPSSTPITVTRPRHSRSAKPA